jgi:hypothetical protein
MLRRERRFRFAQWRILSLLLFRHDLSRLKMLHVSGNDSLARNRCRICNKTTRDAVGGALTRGSLARGVPVGTASVRNSSSAEEVQHGID